ncbi:MAG: HDOD domain-containing protein [Planctomycetes bacterium]|nr:HDOD domain-containing protein [Planctomycetota bacterium]
MTRVLFVDDEPKVLRAIKRMLATVNCDWEADFAPGGREALALLAQTPFDVIVSDMRMPEMDGAALLAEVTRLYPHVARIVLSGHSEQESILRAVGVAHQFLAKPCETDRLLEVVGRAIKLRELLADPKLRTLVSRMSRVPSMPQAYCEMMEQLQSSASSLRDLGAIVARDVGMTAKILQIVNSSFFGLPRHVPDPAYAVCMLGLEVLQSLVLTIHVFAELPVEGLAGVGLHDLWRHSTATGALAKRVAAKEGCDRQVCDHALTAGLLHDTGKLILAANRTEECREAVRLARSDGISLPEAERRVFGATHAEVGAYLLGLWGLPDAVVEAVAFHHRPTDCLGRGFAPVTAVHIANALEHARSATSDEQPPDVLDAAYLAGLGLTERWTSWREQCLEGAHS